MTTTNTCTLTCTSNLDGHCIAWPRVQNCKRWRENEPIVRLIPSLQPFSVMMEEVTAMESLEDRSSRYTDLGREIGELVTRKQAAYGDSFGKAGDVMRILYPGGISLEKMDDALTVVRVLDKLFRIATDRDALGESPWRDVAGYSLLSAARVEDKNA